MLPDEPDWAESCEWGTPLWLMSSTASSAFCHTYITSMAKAVRLAQTVASITPTALKEHLASKPTALKLTGLAAEWPALKSWRLDDGLAAIRQAAGENREVEVELGRKGRGYLDQGYQRVPMGLGGSHRAWRGRKLISKQACSSMPSS